MSASIPCIPFELGSLAEWLTFFGTITVSVLALFQRELHSLVFPPKADIHFFSTPEHSYRWTESLNFYAAALSINQVNHLINARLVLLESKVDDEPLKTYRVPLSLYWASGGERIKEPRNIHSSSPEYFNILRLIRHQFAEYELRFEYSNIESMADAIFAKYSLYLKISLLADNLSHPFDCTVTYEIDLQDSIPTSIDDLGFPIVKITTSPSLVKIFP